MKRIYAAAVTTVLILQGCINSSEETQFPYLEIPEKGKQENLVFKPNEAIDLSGISSVAEKPVEFLLGKNENNGYHNPELKGRLVVLLEESIELAKSKKAQEIKNMKDMDKADSLLLAEMNMLSANLGFEDFRDANNELDKFRNDPEIAALFEELSNAESNN